MELHLWTSLKSCNWKCKPFKQPIGGVHARTFSVGMALFQFSRPKWLFHIFDALVTPHNFNLYVQKSHHCWLTKEYAGQRPLYAKSMQNTDPLNTFKVVFPRCGFNSLLNPTVHAPNYRKPKYRKDLISLKKLATFLVTLRQGNEMTLSHRSD